MNKYRNYIPTYYHSTYYLPTPHCEGTTAHSPRQSIYIFKTIFFDHFQNISEIFLYYTFHILCMSMDPRRAGFNNFAGRSWPEGRTLPVIDLNSLYLEINLTFLFAEKKRKYHLFILMYNQVSTIYIVMLYCVCNISFKVLVSDRNEECITLNINVLFYFTF